jgi:uncharacterized protein (TIGR02600 family)
MKTLRTFFSDARRHKGLALIIVLSMLALATIVILAFLSVADTEHKGTMTYSASQTSRRLADTAVNLVISQIRAASEPEPGSAIRYIHATQPGAVRKYSSDGAFFAGYKLFSDSNMIYRPSTNADLGVGSNVSEQTFVANSEPPPNWNIGLNQSVYVDLNEPVVKGVVTNVSGAVGSSEVFFPVLDPRAAFNMNPIAGAPQPAEGFYYETQTAMTGSAIGGQGTSGSTPAIVKPMTASTPIDSLRLAMPVKWLYMLKDGTTGTLSDSLLFTSSGPSVPSETNPIIGRIAFWADDESCKVNINTASEPTFMGQPTYYHERDHRWADYPPALGEYQRFPGHPATVALSSVFYPNTFGDPARSMDFYGTNAGSAAQTRVLNIKDKIYQLAPRIHFGGSNAGTSLFRADDYNRGQNGTINSVDLSVASTERLYASVDELFFAQTSSGGLRNPNVTTIYGGELFNKQTLERASCLLTSSSRASEISMLGLPRIAMWPVNQSLAKRTGFDNLIQFCSTFGPQGNSYIFERAQATSSVFDITIQRNSSLLSMLDQILSGAVFPAETSNGGKGGTFAQKMGGVVGSNLNYRQVIVEMFDYIRSTNLHDSFLVNPNRSQWPVRTIYWGDDPAKLTNTNLYDERDSLVRTNTYNTFTPGVVANATNSLNPFADQALPGHGQVSASNWQIGGQSYRGFGRTVSISEIGLHFICTADGQPDMYSWRHPVSNGATGANAGLKIPDDIPWTAQNGSLDILNRIDQAAIPGVASTISGGRTALMIEPNPQNLDTRPYQVVHAVPQGFGGEYALKNAAAQSWSNPGITNGQIKRRFYSNYPPLSGPQMLDVLYGTLPPRPIKPMANMSDAERNDYGRSRNNHPGTNPDNWNYTLPQNTPLKPNEKRVQAMLHLEFFCPSVGYTQLTPEFTIVMQASELNSIKVNTLTDTGTPRQEPIFPLATGGVYVLKSGTPLFRSDSNPEVGGYASFRRVAGNRGLPGRSTGGRPGWPGMPKDSRYLDNAPPEGHQGIMNMDLVSNFFTVDGRSTLNFSAGRMKIEIYDTHNWKQATPSQIIFCQLPNGLAPTPDLVVQPTHRVYYLASDESVRQLPTVQAPHWWAFHQRGALGDGTNRNVNVWAGPGRLGDPGDFGFGQRLGLDGGTASRGGMPFSPLVDQQVPGPTALIYGRDGGSFRNVKFVDNRGDINDPSIRWRKIRYRANSENPPLPSDLNYNILAEHFGSDVIRTVQPGHGDARIIAAKSVVQDTEWSPHPLYNSQSAYLAHNFSSYDAGNEPGFDVSGNATVTTEDINRRVLPNTVGMGRGDAPDAPYSGVSSSSLPNATTKSISPAFLAQRYYDFDETDPGGRVGTFINKVDEGNFAVGEFRLSGWPDSKVWRATYFGSNSGAGAKFAPGAPSWFSPNRMVCSPVTMGSLPSRVYSSQMNEPDAALKGGNGAWTNLLFRPHVSYIGGANLKHPGEITPPDHYLLDLFWMPVVEPYAISEPLSTAGKINMNYQMLPFTHIRRATALHAAMKGEMFAALPNIDFRRARAYTQGFGPKGSTAPRFRDETSQITATGGTDPAARWHRTIMIDRPNNPTGAVDVAWWNIPAAERVMGTLRQFEERFNFSDGTSASGPAGVGGSSASTNSLPSNFRGGLFRSASQICELHLIPSRVSLSGINTNLSSAQPNTTTTPNSVTENISNSDLSSYRARENAMRVFWSSHAGTGDNTRERPYSSLYAKLTTRSNTFRVHVRAQTIKKTLRGVGPAQFDQSQDLVVGEFRGSFLVERYIDQADLINAGEAVNFAAGNPLDPTAHPALDTYYRFRVLESKRFAP